MSFKKKFTYIILFLFTLCDLLFSTINPKTYGVISKISQKVIRTSTINSIFDFSAIALSTSSIQWSWSTGTFTGTGITGYHLHSSTTTDIINLTPETSYYIDTNLEVNKKYIRWITVYKDTEESSDSEHIEKYTYALPPQTIKVTNVSSTSAYVT